MTARALTSSELREQFPAGTVMHNPVTGEYARVVEQEERFEVVDGVMGYRLGDHRGELRAGEGVTVAPRRRSPTRSSSSARHARFSARWRSRSRRSFADVACR
jgi:hypothetical protein